ncbi:hypothetical protein [Flexibacterium corallicola]|uniref:hypothetical protein n=1 Tax=Flexibacterium corallicola TaxID=3037259 RepID=UPI00286F21B7|nr:hypothetical protein [Pseudovibrio sp. M1P-2-3]
MSFFLSMFKVGVFNLIAYAALMLAVVAYFARLDPRIPKSLSSVIAIFALCVSVWFFSAVYYDRKDELINLKAQVEAQQQLAAARELISKQANTELLERVEQVVTLQEQVNSYELELENGGVSACPTDPAYIERMQALQFGE